MKSNIAVVALTILLSAAFGLAQQPDRVNAKIPFEFTAAGKVLPAGQYDFAYDAGKRLVMIKGTEAQGDVIMPIITLLAAAMHTTPRDSHIVFDKIGDKHLLSEIWIQGIDGISLLSTKEKHEHEMLTFP